MLSSFDAMNERRDNSRTSTTGRSSLDVRSSDGDGSSSLDHGLAHGLLLRSNLFLGHFFALLLSQLDAELAELLANLMAHLLHAFAHFVGFVRNLTQD